MRGRWEAGSYGVGVQYLGLLGFVAHLSPLSVGTGGGGTSVGGTEVGGMDVGGMDVGGTEVGAGVGTEVEGPDPSVGVGAGVSGTPVDGTEVLVGPEPVWPPEPEPPDPAVPVRGRPTVAVGLGVGVAVGMSAVKFAEVGVCPVPSSPIASTVAATAVWI